MTFLDFGIIDLIDIIIVAYLFYQFYQMVKGTAALNIFIVIIILYFLWWVVRAINMTLLSTILGQVMGVGLIAIIIVFQQEIRRFLLMIWTRYSSINFSFENLMNLFKTKAETKINIEQIVNACENMKKTKTGALIVIPKDSNLDMITETGEKINSDTNTQLLETIFFKNSPLHDGAVIISKDKILAARCVLPVTDKLDLPKNLGLRHRSAIGITESTDSLVIVVSEERGQISYAEFGKIVLNVSADFLTQVIKTKFA